MHHATPGLETSGIEPPSSFGWTDASPPSESYLTAAALRLAGTGHRHVLDVGCGNGWLLRTLVNALPQRPERIVGVDPALDGVTRARQLLPEADIHVLDLSRPLRDMVGDGYDLVLSTEVVEHVYDTPEWMRQIVECMAPGGVFVCSTPYHGWLKNVALAATGKWDRHHQPLKTGGHIKFFSKATLRQLAEDAGLTVEVFAGVGRGPWLWKSMLMRARKA